MKKNYVAPLCTAIVMESAETILSGSVLTGDGSTNLNNILPGDDTYDADFRANGEGSWSVWD